MRALSSAVLFIATLAIPMIAHEQVAMKDGSLPTLNHSDNSPGLKIGDLSKDILSKSTTDSVDPAFE